MSIIPGFSAPASPQGQSHTTSLPSNHDGIDARSADALDRSAIAKAAHIARPHWAGPAWEVSLTARTQAIPFGHHMAPSVGVWWAHVREAFATMNRHGRENLLRVAQALINATDPKTGRIHTIWARIATWIDRSESTVKAHLRRLREAGLLATVASGRSAAAAPKNQPKEALGAVYLPILPNEPKNQPRSPTSPSVPGQAVVTRAELEADVEKSRPPHEEPLGNLPRATPKPAPSSYAQGCQRSFAKAYKQEKQTFWAKNQPLGQRELSRKYFKRSCQRAARTIQLHSLELRQLSHRAIAYEIRPFMNAGWSPKDILHALTHSPAGYGYRMEVAAKMRSLRSWLQLRLTEWVTAAGEVMNSPTARQEAAETARRDQRAQESAKISRRPSAAVSAPSTFRAYCAMLRIHGAETALEAFPQYAARS